jgi:tagatose 1,6-diphosphate aldolase
MQSVSNSRGVIAAAAMDQRGSLQKAIAKDRGVEKNAITQQMMEEFKSAVVRVLSPYASAFLLDPEFGLPAAKVRAKNCGLLLAYEKTGYDANKAGRLPDLLDVYSVRRVVAAGADCLKILLYYSPFDTPQINEQKHAWTERIGDECRANDVPFFLEFVTYKDGVEDASIDFARVKPDAVIRSMEEFSKPQYGVDVLKVEIPVNMAFVKGTKACKGEHIWTRDEAKDLFRKAASVAKRPFIYLSAGVSNDVFAETLDLAGETGVNFSGVLCGRATWKEGVPIYGKHGIKALEDWLADQGVKNIQNVNAKLTAAKPWFEFYGAKSAAALAD